MKIISCEVYSYKLPLVRQLQINGEKILFRKGLILRIKDEEGYCGYGEIAPLPGLNTESLDETLKQLKTFSAHFPDTVPPDLWKLEGAFEQWFDGISFAPSVGFGIETAVLNLVANRRKTPLYKLISDNSRKRISVNALLTGKREDLLKETAQMLSHGYRSFKLKVGRSDMEKEVALVKELSCLIGTGATLRLDANRAWALDDAVGFTEAVSHTSIEYIEEPLRDIELLRDFIERSDIPVAVDESLHLLDFQLLSSFERIKAVILKPAVIGGLEKTAEYIRRAENLSILPVISDTFHSGVGLSASAGLASGKLKKDVPAGLDTYRYLADDLLVERFSIEKGCLDLSVMDLNRKEPSPDKLQKVM